MSQETIKHSEAQTLARSMAALAETTGLTASSRAQHGRNGNVATITLTDGKRRWKLKTEVKLRLTNQSLGPAIASVSEIDDSRGAGALVTRYVNPVQAYKLRSRGVQFFDSAGNAFFHQDGLYVFVTGRKPQDTTGMASRPVRAFNDTGLRLIFALLSLPTAVNEPYRELAQKANISLGAVNWIMDDLRRLGYLIDDARGRRLTNKRELLNRWVSAYAEQLRPKLVIGRFRTNSRPDWWKQAKLSDRSFWGGEIGAAMITQYLQPEGVTIYAADNLAGLQAKYGLRRDANGEIELLQKFWHFTEWNHKEAGVAPPVLIYADLLLTADERNLETAKLIYGRDIIRLIE